MTTRLSEKVFETLKFGDVRRLYYQTTAATALTARGYTPDPQEVVEYAEKLWRADVRSGVWEDKEEA